MKWNVWDTRASLNPPPAKQCKHVKNILQEKTAKTAKQLQNLLHIQNCRAKQFLKKTIVRQMISFISNSVNITMIGTVQLYTKTTWYVTHVKNKQNNVLQTLSNG